MYVFILDKVNRGSALDTNSKFRLETDNALHP